MARIDIKYNGIKTPTEAAKDEIIKRIVKNAFPKIDDVCNWYKYEVASFKHVYYNGYSNMEQTLGPIILAEEPEIKIYLVNSSEIRVSIKMFDDSLGGSLDQQTTTAESNGKQKQQPAIPQLGWWRFFEDGAHGSTTGRSHNSTSYGFVKTGQDTGFMAPLGIPFLLTTEGSDGKPKHRFVIPNKPHPGVMTVGFFQGTWKAKKEEFLKKIRQAIIESITQ